MNKRRRFLLLSAAIILLAAWTHGNFGGPTDYLLGGSNGNFLFNASGEKLVAH